MLRHVLKIGDLAVRSERNAVVTASACLSVDYGISTVLCKTKDDAVSEILLRVEDTGQTEGSCLVGHGSNSVGHAGVLLTYCPLSFYFAHSTANQHLRTVHIISLGLLRHRWGEMRWCLRYERSFSNQLNKLVSPQQRRGCNRPTYLRLAVDKFRSRKRLFRIDLHRWNNWK